MALGSCAKGGSDNCDLIASVRACTELIVPAPTDSGSGREAATKSAPALAAGALSGSQTPRRKSNTNRTPIHLCLLLSRTTAHYLSVLDLSQSCRHGG